ncbi:GyrI-like domain-containing protein [uncultured Methanobrevibacter sp.]|uniref:GyrI-like domain-containing protein n=1 Tax=uncultured Methanobrevibacter sp. TaxID=253161 RepID=UPI0025E0BD77|nr:GyrI-like domain-containing protein [uncultured Methanobrevibacter sp.]
MKIKEKTIEDLNIAVISNKGSLEAAKILFAKLSGWIESGEGEVAGNPFMIFYKLPEDIGDSELLYDVGMPTSELMTGDDLVNTAVMIEHKVLSAVHEGKRDNIINTYRAIAKYADENNYDIIGSPKEVFINGFLENNNEKLTEVQLPVIKM